MLQATVIDDRHKAAWDAFVHRHPGTIAWHLYDWSNVLRTYYGTTFHPIAALEGDEIRAILPLYRVRTLRTGVSLVSIPYVVAGGIVADDEQAERLVLEESVRLSQSMGSPSIALKQYGHCVAGDLRTDGGYYNQELSLSAGAAQVWKNLPVTLQESIESISETGLQLDYPSTDVAAFHLALSRHQRAGGVPAPSRRWIELLLGSKLYQMALLRSGGRVVAGTMLKVFRQTASFPYTCVAQRGDVGVNWARRFYWEMIKRLSAEGFQIVHSGRIPNNGAVPAYRLGWGGERREYYYQYYGLQGKTESGSKRGRSRAVVEAVWRRMPLTLANLLSPPLLRQYP
ncbi:MAG: hypothetical protein K8T91_25080 [Planctomycetes bacterium]|nr:hypothetical protein [Planctomycetota bacterium]